MSDGETTLFTHSITVRFHEVDRAGIAFFGRTFEYCHETFEEFLAAAADGLASVFDDEGWGMPLVHAEADYHRPLKMGDRIAISMTVEKLGQSSVTFRFVLRGEGGEKRATARLVHAFVNLSDFTKRGVPETLRNALVTMGFEGE